MIYSAGLAFLRVICKETLGKWNVIESDTASYFQPSASRLTYIFRRSIHTFCHHLLHNYQAILTRHLINYSILHLSSPLQLQKQHTLAVLQEPTIPPTPHQNTTHTLYTMSDDWESTTKIGSKVRGPGVAQRETTIKGKSALNAAQRTGAIVATEKKFSTANVSTYTQQQRY